jgi:hypothetical protein
MHHDIEMPLNHLKRRKGKNTRKVVRQQAQTTFIVLSTNLLQLHTHLHTLLRFTLEGCKIYIHMQYNIDGDSSYKCNVYHCIIM